MVAGVGWQHYTKGGNMAEVIAVRVVQEPTGRTVAVYARGEHDPAAFAAAVSTATGIGIAPEDVRQGRARVVAGELREAARAGSGAFVATFAAVR